jgi:hypothetical protein
MSDFISTLEAEYKTFLKEIPEEPAIYTVKYFRSFQAPLNWCKVVCIGKWSCTVINPYRPESIFWFDRLDDARLFKMSFREGLKS